MRIIILILFSLLIGCSSEPSSLEIKNKVLDLRAEATKLLNKASEIAPSNLELKNKIVDLKTEAEKLNNKADELEKKLKTSDFSDKVFSIENESVQPVVYELNRHNGEISGKSKLLTEVGYLDSDLKIKDNGKGTITLTTLSNGNETSKFVGKIIENSETPFLEGKWKTSKTNEWIPTRLNIDSNQYSYYSKSTGEKLWKELCKELKGANKKYGSYCESLRLLNELYKLYKPQPNVVSSDDQKVNSEIPISVETQRFCFSSHFNSRTSREKDCCVVFNQLSKAYSMYRDDPDRLLIASYVNTSNYHNCKDEKFKEFVKEHKETFKGWKPAILAPFIITDYEVRKYQYEKDSRDF